MVALGVSTASLAALQKLTRYSERAEAAKNVAKSYARIARRIETTMVLVQSSAVRMDTSAFLKFIDDMEKELEAILNNTDEVPARLLLLGVGAENNSPPSTKQKSINALKTPQDCSPAAAATANDDRVGRIQSQVHAMAMAKALPSEGS